jgi:hypothetical protein
MRLTTILGMAIGAVLSVAAAAQADSPPYTVATTGGTVVVSAGTGYHINAEFPWKVTQGTTAGAPTLADKSKFQIAPGTATLANAPKGTNTLRGAYCSVNADGTAGSCTPFSTTITVQ